MHSHTDEHGRKHRKDVCLNHCDENFEQVDSKRKRYGHQRDRVGLEEEDARALINRSKEALLTIAMTISSDDKDETEDLISIEGIDMALALELNLKGIKNREDLAEQSVDELIELVEMDEKKAAELIMKAREHWFNED